MSTNMMLTEQEYETLRKKFFPRVPWTDDGPVRRRYLVRATSEESVVDALIWLARSEQFIGPGQEAVTGGADACLVAFRKRAVDSGVAMIFGAELAAHWCDLALGEPDDEGWQEMIVRSEEAENLIALAHARGILRFRKAE